MVDKIFITEINLDKATKKRSSKLENKYNEMIASLIGWVLSANNDSLRRKDSMKKRKKMMRIVKRELFSKRLIGHGSAPLVER